MSQREDSACEERKTGSLYTVLAIDLLDLNYFPNLINV